MRRVLINESIGSGTYIFFLTFGPYQTSLSISALHPLFTEIAFCNSSLLFPCPCVVICHKRRLRERYGVELFLFLVVVLRTQSLSHCGRNRYMCTAYYIHVTWTSEHTKGCIFYLSNAKVYCQLTQDHPHESNCLDKDSQGKTVEASWITCRQVGDLDQSTNNGDALVLLYIIRSFSEGRNRRWRMKEQNKSHKIKPKNPIILIRLRWSVSQGPHSKDIIERTFTD